MNIQSIDLMDTFDQLKNKIDFLMEVSLVANLYDIRELTNKDCKNGYHILVRETQDHMQEFKDNLKAILEGGVAS